RGHHRRQRPRQAPGMERERPRRRSSGVNATLRRLTNVVMNGLTSLAAILVICPLLLILGFLLYRGISAINVDFFIHLPKPVGEAGGGVANAIVGGLIMAGLAVGLRLHLGILGGGYVAEPRGVRRPSVVGLRGGGV